MRHYRIQLIDSVTGKAISAAGGAVYVATADGAAKIALLDKTGASASNPSALTNGIMEFYVADSVAAADLYVQAPSGHFVVAKGIAASGPNVLNIDKSRSDATMVIPFSITDTTAAVETDTGFDLPTNAAVLPNSIGMDVITLDAGETADLGILASEGGGDANGFIALGSVAAVASIIAGAVITDGSTEEYFSSTTLGALIDPLFTAGVDDGNADVGTSNPQAHICDGTAKSISYTLTAGTDLAEGFFKIPLQLPVASL